MVDSSAVRDDILISTETHFQFFVLLICLLVLFIFYFLYFFIKNKAFQDLGSFLLYAKVFFFVCLGIIMLILLITRFLIVEITENAKDCSIVFMLIVALLMQFYLNITFSGIMESNNKIIQYGLLIIVIYIMVSSFGETGLRVILNIDVFIPLVLQEKTFESNTPNGIRFMFGNLVVLLVLHAITFIMERKRKS